MNKRPARILTTLAAASIALTACSSGGSSPNVPTYDFTDSYVAYGPEVRAVVPQDLQAMHDGDLLIEGFHIKGIVLDSTEHCGYEITPIFADGGEELLVRPVKADGGVTTPESTLRRAITGSMYVNDAEWSPRPIDELDREDPKWGVFVHDDLRTFTSVWGCATSYSNPDVTDEYHVPRRDDEADIGFSPRSQVRFGVSVLTDGTVAVRGMVVSHIRDQNGNWVRSGGDSDWYRPN